MSIKIDWVPMAADTLTLYWSSSPFTQDTLPTDKVVLTPSSGTYTDTTVPANTNRYYMIEAIKAGATTQYSQCMLYGNWAKTGPGNNAVLRGTWDAGYMGFVPVAQMFTISGLRTALGSPSIGAPPADNTMTGWHKFIFKGKILFFPNNICSSQGSTTWAQIYNAGCVYGVDGPGSAPMDLTQISAQPNIPTLVNQKRVVTVGTDSFLVRLPKNSTLPTGTSVPDRTTFKGSEWCELMCSLTTSILAADVPLLQPYKWGDVQGVPYPLAGMQHFNGLSNLAASNANWSDYFGRNITVSPSGGWITWVPVLEYIPS